MKDSKLNVIKNSSTNLVDELFVLLYGKNYRRNEMIMHYELRIVN